MLSQKWCTQAACSCPAVCRSRSPHICLKHLLTQCYSSTILVIAAVFSRLNFTIFGCFEFAFSRLDRLLCFNKCVCVCVHSAHRFNFIKCIHKYRKISTNRQFFPLALFLFWSERARARIALLLCLCWFAQRSAQIRRPNKSHARFMRCSHEIHRQTQIIYKLCAPC